MGVLPSLGHALSGATGTAISTVATYPLDLVTTRLKVQRQLALDGALPRGDDDDDGKSKRQQQSEQEDDKEGKKEEGGPHYYRGVRDAFATIYAREGGAAAFFAGLGADVGKSVADSFLFFLFYSWLRARRVVVLDGRGTETGTGMMGRRRRREQVLRVAEELAVGAAAGACARLVTTPVGNVVTRRQTARLLDGGGGAGTEAAAAAAAAEQRSFGEIVDDIRRERGVLGLWAGYSASLVLTLNPSITFLLQNVLKRALVPRERWDEPGAPTTFFLAAVSKVVATALTYPFQIAKARLQVSAAPAESEEGSGRKVLENNIFATVLRIARTEGRGALYDGVAGELLKGFFSHGTTMLSKDVVHRVTLQLYFAILAALKQHPQLRATLSKRMQQARDEVRERYRRASSGAEGARRKAHHVRSAIHSRANS